MSSPASPERNPAAFIAEPDFVRLKRTVVDTIGLQYYDDKDLSLAERAEQRRGIVGCSRAEYLRRVLDPANGEELAAFVDEITIGETYFFRYPAQFDALRRVVLPERIAWRQPDRTLRIWSAGCASGAEPYSVAITLRRHFTVPTAGWDISILGTDINRKLLTQARRGTYSEWDLRGETAELKDGCFAHKAAGWQLHAGYRDFVEFRRQNLVTEIDAFARDNAGAFDIIFCRNVMIYFSPALTRRLIRLLSDCLTEGGWLFVGHAEPYFEIANVLTPVRLEGVTLYRRSGDAAARDRPWFEPIAEMSEPATEPAAWEPPVLTDWPENVPTARPAATTPAKAAEPAPTASAIDVIRRHADAGEWPDALAACAKALRRTPLDAAIHYVQGLIHEQVGAPAAAEESFSRAIYVERDFALAHFHSGLCHARRGDHRAARRSLSNVLRILDGRDPRSVVAMGDGLTVQELRELTRVRTTALREQ